MTEGRVFFKHTGEADGKQLTTRKPHIPNLFPKAARCLAAPVHQPQLLGEHWQLQLLLKRT